jgi:hypothetical protein
MNVKIMQPDKKKIWFPAKRYGWGWGLPCAWQGWVVLVASIAAISGGAFLLLPEHLQACLGLSAGVTSIVMIICFIKGEKPRWRWGGD